MCFSFICLWTVFLIIVFPFYILSYPILTGRERIISSIAFNVLFHALIFIFAILVLYNTKSLSLLLKHYHFTWILLHYFVCQKIKKKAYVTIQNYQNLHVRTDCYFRYSIFSTRLVYYKCRESWIRKTYWVN
ncbi:uncharacterized protein BX663DRAFT_540258 [Cokeromyces recurvatus]|uniref:uncharacterized protein n=1 Tax=Cokeromyces recurvatus TaxID=90255 RepID=UPI00221E547F|nr:uncharacterized protein BX663DRAFT_540258 [Cokeromyces recurvatus]KAI7906498.1 hypothetical protein BX663DRAFT_540258 [Cokeromyces recurvatus]